jgi:hypothetical protein
MPKGSVAPGNVLPPPAVPMKGSTLSYGVLDGWARAETVLETKNKVRQRRKELRIAWVLGEKFLPKNNIVASEAE